MQGSHRRSLASADSPIPPTFADHLNAGESLAIYCLHSMDAIPKPTQTSTPAVLMMCAGRIHWAPIAVVKADGSRASASEFKVDDLSRQIKRRRKKPLER